MRKRVTWVILCAVFLIISGGGIVSLFLSDLKSVEPQIVEMDDHILFAGMSVKTDMKHIYRDAAALGNAYASFKKEHAIPGLKEPWAFVAYSRDFNETDRSWEYIMGDVVTSLDSVPEGLNGCEIPRGLYAVFTIRARFAFLWGLEIGRMKKMIFTQWLPRSGYEATGCDFELHDARSAGKRPSIDLYVEVRKK